MSKITVLGMGAMGSRMARSLIKAGHELTVWNRSLSRTELMQETGAKIAETPRAAVKNAEFVISMVRDDEASKQVWLDSQTGALAGLAKNAVAIESSTLTVAWIEELGRQMQKHGIAFLDAPVAGTRPQAEAARLIYFVGGDAAIFAIAKPILQEMGSVVNYVGTVGSGMTVKLAVNAILAIQVSAFAELIGLIAQSGLNKAQALKIISATPVCSPAAKMAATAMVEHQFSPLFPIELVAKDLSYALTTAEANKVMLPLVQATQKVYTAAIQQGYGNDNITGVAQLYR